VWPPFKLGLQTPLSGQNSRNNGVWAHSDPGIGIATDAKSSSALQSECKDKSEAKHQPSGSIAMSRGFFHFPLCLLAFGEDYKQRLQHIMSYCLYEHAKRSNPDFPKVARKSQLDDAATFLDINIGSHNGTIARWRTADSFLCRWEGRYGKDPRVRIGTSLLWEAHNTTGASYREFSILCAINSIIGHRRSIPKRITEPSIQVRAAGFKSWNVAQLELSCDPLGKGTLLTVNQVRYTLEKLHQRKFFARARAGAKTVKYMLGVSDDELRFLLLKSETYRQRFKAERAKKDAELMAAIRSAKRQSITLTKIDTAPTSMQHDNDVVPSIIPDINICSSNNGSFNSSTE
jgi:hypothetical protein